MLELHVSGGNTKLGEVPNVSLLPIVTCDKCAGCTRPRPGVKRAKGTKPRPHCYAAKIMLMYPKVRSQWKDNTTLASDPAEYFEQLQAWFDARRAIGVPWFRFHIGGDCPTPAYIKALIAFCKKHPTTRFLVFTKRYQWFNRYRSLPANLAVVYSAWPGHSMVNPHNRPVAWVEDDRQPDARIPAHAMPCPGDCSACMVCWGIQKGHSVVFKVH